MVWCVTDEKRLPALSGIPIFGVALNCGGGGVGVVRLCALLAASAAIFARAFIALLRCECIGSYIALVGVLPRVPDKPLPIKLSSDASCSSANAMPVRCVFRGSRSGKMIPRRPRACLRLRLQCRVSCIRVHGFTIHSYLASLIRSFSSLSISASVNSRMAGVNRSTASVSLNVDFKAGRKLCRSSSSTILEPLNS